MSAPILQRVLRAHKPCRTTMALRNRVSRMPQAKRFTPVGSHSTNRFAFFLSIELSMIHSLISSA